MIVQKDNIRYKVRLLKQAHDASGKSWYQVASDLKISKNTVQKYTEHDGVLINQQDTALAALCFYYGVPYHEAVEVVILENDEGSPEGQTKTLLAAS